MSLPIFCLTLLGTITNIYATTTLLFCVLTADLAYLPVRRQIAHCKDDTGRFSFSIDISNISQKPIPDRCEENRCLTRCVDGFWSKYIRFERRIRGAHINGCLSRNTSNL